MAKTVHEEEYRLIDKVSAGFATIANGVKGLSNRFTELNQATELAGKGIGLVVSAAKGIGDAVGGAADYEEAMRRVSIRTQATADEQVQLQQAVRDAADAVGATAEEAAAALLNMANDGYSARDAIDNLGTVLAYAKVQARGTAEAAAGLGGILDSFGARASLSVGQVADALTATAAAAGTTSDTLEKGLAGIGVAAQDANLSFEQTVALLGQLATRNIEGADAAKRLATIFDEFKDPASKAGKALADMGLSGADLTTILKRLSTDSAAATTVLETLGKKPRDALITLLEDGGGALQEMTRIVDANKGATQAAADALEGTFNDSLKNVVAQLDVLRQAAAGPVLTPLAEGLQVLADRLSAFAKSPEFATLTQQFAAFVTSSTEGISKFIETLDFEAATAKISAFVNGASDTFDALVVVVKATASAIRGIGAAIEYVQEVTDTLDAAMASAVGGTNRLNVAAREAGKGIDGLGVGLDKNKKSTREHAAATDTATASVKLFATASGQAGAAAATAAEQLGEIPKAAKLTEISMEKLAGGAAQAAIGLERFRLATLVAAQVTLYNANLSNSDSFRALTVEIGKTEASIATMQAAIDEAAKSNNDLANSADTAAGSMRNQASAADRVASSADGARDSTSQASEEFGNIGNQSSSAAVSMGTLTEEFVRNALAVAGNAKSVRDYLRTINDFFAQGQDEENQLRAMIEIRERQNATLTEEDRIRRRIKDQYGESSTLVEKLVQLELKLAEAKRKTNDEGERGIEIEQRRAGVAGGIGTQGGPATAAGPATSAGRGTVAGAGSRDAAPAIVVNVSGAPTDAAGWRDIVSRFIAPELERINRLSR